MSKALRKTCSGIGAILGIVSGLMGILSARAQQFGLDPTQAQISGAWNMQSAEFNYCAAVLTAAAASLIGIAVFFDD